MTYRPSLGLSLATAVALIITNSPCAQATSPQSPTGVKSKKQVMLSAPAARRDEDDLTREYARFRKAQVEKVDYEMYFTFKKGSEEFEGRTQITTALTRTDQPLSIDSFGAKIRSIRVNGQPLEAWTERTGSFDIPAKHLQPSNKIEIVYTTAFSKDGRGVMRSVDPEDGAEYIFTDFEPFDAHRLFPCFDQPDLRASYQVTLDTPKDWRAIANELAIESKPSKDRVVTRFRSTPRFSTYLVFIGAGPYSEWKDQYKQTPLYIWSRKSLAKYVDHERIFATTKKGLQFFEDFFAHDYPFSKYGQIFIPEFASGGMENPGAIALNERNLWRGPVTQTQIDGRDSLLLHEMAHMWFGDLVTMQWWNDLWLNESFASYMAALALDRAMGAKSAWLDFFHDKGWGYWQDQLPTTHPIETDVPDVRTSKGNFDGITYAKGGATLKQLHFFVGESGFRDGVRSYFKKFPWQNTIRADFINAIAESSKKDLRAWTKAWLQSAGPQRVRTKWACKDGKISSFSIEQGSNQSRVRSPHQTRLALMKTEGNGKFNLIKTADVVYAGATTKVSGLNGVMCPDFVYPNFEDFDYALFSIDEKSLAHARSALTGGIQDPLLRLMIWENLGQMVRDTEWNVNDFFNLALAALEVEGDESILGILLGRQSTLRNYYFFYLTAERRAELAARLESVLWKRIGSAPAGSDLQMIFWDFYVSTAQSVEANARLQAAFKGEELPKGFRLDQDRRWALISQLASHGSPDVAKLIVAEEKSDSSTTGQRFAYAARAAIPTTESKKKFWHDMQNADQIPFSSLRMAARAFHHSNFNALTAEFRKPFFERVASLDWKSNDAYVEVYFESLFPSSLCTSDLLSESQTRLKKTQGLTALAKRAWVEANEELSKCIAVRRKAGFINDKKTDRQL